MQTDPTACHSLIGPLAALLRSPCLNTHRANVGNLPGLHGHDGDHAIDSRSGGCLCCGTLTDTVTIQPTFAGISVRDVTDV